MLMNTELPGSCLVYFVRKLLYPNVSPYPAPTLPPYLPFISGISKLGYTFLPCENIPPATVKTICGVNAAFLLGHFTTRGSERQGRCDLNTLVGNVYTVTKRFSFGEY